MGQRGASQKPTVSARAVLPHPSGFKGPGAQVWPLPRESRCARAPGWGGVHVARHPGGDARLSGGRGSFPFTFAADLQDGHVLAALVLQGRLVFAEVLLGQLQANHVRGENAAVA